MTRNQIEFANVRETARHNLATEARDIQSLSEAVRHNQQEEGVNWYNASTLASLRQAQSENLEAQTKLYGAQTVTEEVKPSVYFSEIGVNEAKADDLKDQIADRLRKYELSAEETAAAIREIESRITRAKFQNARDAASAIDTIVDDVLDAMNIIKNGGSTGQSRYSGISYLTSP